MGLFRRIKEHLRRYFRRDLTIIIISDVYPICYNSFTYGYCRCCPNENT